MATPRRKGGALPFHQNFTAGADSALAAVALKGALGSAP
jgi:hypothetical protein